MILKIFVVAMVPVVVLGELLAALIFLFLGKVKIGKKLRTSHLTWKTKDDYEFTFIHC